MVGKRHNRSRGTTSRSRNTAIKNEAIPVNSQLIAKWFRVGDNYSGIVLDENGALALSAVWRSVAVVAGTLASLPLRSYRDADSGQRERVTSIFDNPGGDHGPTPFEWKETVFAHLLLHGNAFLYKLRNEAGAVVELVPFHPVGVAIEEPTPEDFRRGVLPLGGKWFNITMQDNTRKRLDAVDILHVPALSLDGVRGLSPIEVASNSLGTAAAGDRAAAKVFSSGALISGLVTPDDEDVEPEEATELQRQLDSATGGYENAGSIAVVNKRMKFQPWTMSAADAQFLQSRQFSIEEISRWWGVHPTLLMQTDKQTSWGTGIEEQNRGLGRTVLQPWAQRLEQRGSRILPRPRFIEFDFAGLERPSPKDEIELLMKQTGNKPILTVNEARAIRNLPPIAGGDTLGTPAAPPSDPIEEGEDADPEA